MSLTISLARLERWLRENSPTTWEALRPSAALADIDLASHRFGLRLLPDLKRLWLWRDGSAGGILNGLPLQPGHYFLGVGGALDEWRSRTDVSRSHGDSRSWSPQWMPITSDGAGNHLVVDHRPGADSGSVFLADLQNGPMSHRSWSSLGDLVDSLCDALAEGTAVDGHRREITEQGRLIWNLLPSESTRYRT
ncbi:SMI1/KNR4 family protein [Plantactinospora sp. B6F1]|uniref:SMI1/KNR4 family protein n=1 Tax=Plantactinospora sp. B6F1 TaxID=3158971 RepID=UPI0032D8E387